MREEASDEDTEGEEADISCTLSANVSVGINIVWCEHGKNARSSGVLRGKVAVWEKYCFLARFCFIYKQ